MTKEQILNSIKLKKRFCKDYGITISVYDNPYFYNRLRTMDAETHCIGAFNLFCLELVNFEDEQSYFAYRQDIENRIIHNIESNAKYQEFNNKFDIPQIDVSCNYTNGDIYNSENADRVFLSIDMKKANFNALRIYSDNEIFDGISDYDEYISTYTKYTHIINSKHMRQVIFGKLNPKRQIRYEQYLMKTLLNYLCENLILPEYFDKIYLHNDEILFRFTDDVLASDNVDSYDCSSIIKHFDSCLSYFNQFGNTNKYLNTDLFRLLQIPNSAGYVKVSSYSNTASFKCVDSDIYIQVFKHFFNVPIIDDDLVFYHNGRLSRFLQAVDFNEY